MIFFFISLCGIVLGYGLDDQGFKSQQELGIFHPGLLWGPPSLLSNGYWGLFPWCKAARVL